MKKFEVEKADEMIKAAKEKVNTLSVTSPADGVIDDIVKVADEKMRYERYYTSSCWSI